MARRKGKKGGRRKKGGFQLVKGGLYAGAIIAPLAVAYQQSGGGAEGAKNAVMAAAFVDPTTNKFSMVHGAQIWTPVAALAVVDVVTSKVGLQRRIARGLSALGL